MSLHPPFREAAEAWLAEDPDPKTADELRALIANADSGDTAAQRDLHERFDGPLEFGTAGLRGVLGAGPNRMNRARRARDEPRARGSYLRGACPRRAQRGVVIGHDGAP